MSQTMIVSSDDDDGKILQDSGVDSGVVTDDGEAKMNQVTLFTLHFSDQSKLLLTELEPKYNS